ncbi:MAG: hypothetical protein Q9202_006696 [Teloschistes flavicans]
MAAPALLRAYPIRREGGPCHYHWNSALTPFDCHPADFETGANQAISPNKADSMDVTGVSGERMQDASPAESFAIGQRMIARGGEYECEKYVHCVEPPHVIKCTNPPVMDQATRDALWGKKKEEGREREKGK